MLKDINIGSYGEIPKRAPYRGMAIRGVPEDEDTLDMGYTINTAAEVMSANVFSLYEEAKARQWNAARDIPWAELPRMDPDVEHAMCKLCSFLTEVEFIAADAPAQFLPHINHCYLEAKIESSSATTTSTSGSSGSVCRTKPGTCLMGPCTSVSSWRSVPIARRNCTRRSKT